MAGSAEITQRLVQEQAIKVAKEIWPIDTSLSDKPLVEHLEHCNFMLIVDHLNSMNVPANRLRIADFFSNICYGVNFPNPEELAAFWMLLAAPDQESIKEARRKVSLSQLTDTFFKGLGLSVVPAKKTEEILTLEKMIQPEEWSEKYNTVRGDMKRYADKSGKLSSFIVAMDITRLGVLRAFDLEVPLMANLAALCAGWNVLKGVTGESFPIAMSALEGIYQQGYFFQGFKEGFWGRRASLFDPRRSRRIHRD